MARLSELLDAIPRTRVGILGREAPAFRTAGVCGYYVAVLAVLILGSLAQRSLFALLGASSVCALSFFGYALLRKALTGRERLVLLEHVWVALLASAGFFYVAQVPVAAHLDPVVVGLAFFLACGRAGCTMVGCCHGRPSEVGIRYGDDAVRDGFPRHLHGVRLFPVQLIEALGLSLLGLFLIPVLFLATPGAALGAFLLGYGVMRFGLEGLRGDERPHFLGLSQSRWMALAEVVLALALSVPRRELLAPSRSVVAGGAAALAALVLLLAFSWRAARRERRLLSPAHVTELHELVTSLSQHAGAKPSVATSSLGLRVALSRSAPRSEHEEGAASRHGLLASFSQPEGTRDTGLLVRLVKAVGDGRWSEPRALRAGVLVVSDGISLESEELPPAPRGRANKSEPRSPEPRASYFQTDDAHEGRNMPS